MVVTVKVNVTMSTVEEMTLATVARNGNSHTGSLCRLGIGGEIGRHSPQTVNGSCTVSIQTVIVLRYPTQSIERQRVMRPQHKQQ